jgi:hypothetical protein
MYRRRARPSDRLTSRTIRGQRRAAQARDRGSLGRSRTRISHTILKRIVGSTCAATASISAKLDTYEAPRL